MACRLFRVTRSFYSNGQVQQVGWLIRINDRRPVAPLFAAGQIEPPAETAMSNAGKPALTTADPRT
jgi:hypothetical protein